MTRVEDIPLSSSMRVPEYYDDHQPDEDLKKWEKVWRMLDSEGRGALPLEDLQAKILRTSFGDELPAEVVMELLIRSDLNRDGMLQKNEFYTLISNTQKRPWMTKAIVEAGLLVVPRRERNATVRRYLDEFNCLPPPFFMIGISLLEVAVFIYYAVEMDEPVYANGPTPLYSPLIYNPYRRYEAWRFITYMLLHSGYVHLINNLLVQLFLGVPLELVHKWWRLMVIYLVGVTAGSLATSLVTPNVYLVGASGGVYAVEYAYIGNIILNWSEMRYAWAQALFLGLLSVADFGYAIWDTHFSGKPSNTGHTAHIAGAVAGILTGVLVLRNLKLKKWERVVWWICLVLLLIFFVIAIIIHIAYPQHFPPSQR